MATTYHSKNGKFSSSSSAHSAVRDGERLKVVRQLRRLHRNKPVAMTSEEKARELVMRGNLARIKAQMTGELTAPGFVNVSDILR